MTKEWKFKKTTRQLTRGQRHLRRWRKPILMALKELKESPEKMPESMAGRTPLMLTEASELELRTALEDLELTTHRFLVATDIAKQKIRRLM